jgi:hypothetical protein
VPVCIPLSTGVQGQLLSTLESTLLHQRKPDDDLVGKEFDAEAKDISFMYQHSTALFTSGLAVAISMLARRRIVFHSFGRISSGVTRYTRIPSNGTTISAPSTSAGPNKNFLQVIIHVGLIAVHTQVSQYRLNVVPGFKFGKKGCGPKNTFCRTKVWDVPIQEHLCTGIRSCYQSN